MGFRDGQEQVVTVPVGELLGRLRANRDRHRRVFEAALEGYRKEAQARLRSQLRALKAGVPPEIRLILAPPEDHTRDYDRVIAMVEMHTEATLSVGESQFAQYVLDDWGWKGRWLDVANIYAAGTTQTEYGSS